MAAPFEPAAAGPSDTRPVRLGAFLTTTVGLCYGAFLMAGAFAPQRLAAAAVGSVPWSFLLGIGLLVLAVASTGLYARAANRWEARND